MGRVWCSRSGQVSQVSGVFMSHGGTPGFLHHPLNEAIADFLGAATSRLFATGEYAGGYLLPPVFADALLTPHQLAFRLAVPVELLMEYGVIPDTRPAPPPPSRRTRFRWWLLARRESAGQLAYRVISGSEFLEGGYY